MAKAKIVHFSSVHPRYDVRVFQKEATSAAKFYNTCLVVADGLGDETLHGVHIKDVGAAKGRIYRILISTFLVGLKVYRLRGDVYHFHDPELIPVALILKLLGKKVIFDMHENTDLQILEKPWIPKAIRRLVANSYYYFEKLSCACFDHIVVPQELMIGKYAKEFKTSVIYNFPEVRRGDTSKCSVPSRYQLIYSGAVSDARGFKNMVSLIEELIKIDLRYELRIAGNLSQAQQVYISHSSGKNNIKLLGYLNKDELKREYLKSYFGLILFNNVGQYGMAYALKLFEYMQYGLVVIMPNFGEWIEFNENNQAGFCVDTVSATTVAEKLNSLSLDELSAIRENNKAAVIKKYSWQSQEPNLINLYQVILNGTSA